MTLAVKFKCQFVDKQVAFDLALSSSKITAIFGPSGVGKTTLLRVIAGLENPHNSNVVFNGVEWQGSSKFIATEERNIGFVFQQPSLFEHLDVQQNIEYGIRRRKLPLQALEPYLSELYAILGLEALLKRAVSDLSGGEQQRVAIARALACKPQLLLMDEPLASLDDELKQLFMGYLERLQSIVNIPIIYVSHSRDEVSRLADETVLVAEGRVVAQGNTFDIFTDLSLPLASANNAKSVIQALVVQHDEKDHLSTLSSEIGNLSVRKLDCPLNEKLKLGIRAADVSIALSVHTRTSILNVLKAKIIDWTDCRDGVVTLKLHINEGTLLSQITKRSFDDLALQKGMDVYAQIKGVALI